MRIALGVACASIGALLVVAAASLEFGPPPECPFEGGGCPSHYDVLGFSVDEAYAIGVVLIVSGIVLALIGVFGGPELPFSRVDEDAVVESIERATRRLD